MKIRQRKTKFPGIASSFVGGHRYRQTSTIEELPAPWIVPSGTNSSSARDRSS